ncbi:MAG: RHS repeat-associated core domain-containing protein [Flavobacterium sp.]
MKHFYFTLIFLINSLFISAQTPTGGSTEVGITEGQLSVSLTGSALYSIPIAVPPGINGVVPQVGLVYNSQGGNGLAGYGWNISGISAITRIPSTKFHDGTIDEVDFDSLDRFALDGQRLVIKSGTNGIYGANGTVYETENFSNIKITSLIGTSGQIWFKVEYPDGSIALYGTANDSSTNMVWGISSWENPQGVRISYSYILTNNNLSIEYIKYGSIATNTPINQIKFIYGARQRPEQAYVGGQSILKNTILSTIQVTGNGVGFRNYILDYNSTSLGYQRLKKITESSGDGTKSLNPTVFDYEDTPVSIASNPKKGILNYPENFSSDEDFAGDFNDDGKIDLIGYNSITGNIPDGKRYILSDISGNGDIQAKPLTILAGANDVFSVTMLSKDNKIASYKGLLVINGTADSKNYTFNVYSLQNNIEILEYQKKIDFTFLTANDGDYVSAYYKGDFNGDGLTDILMKRDNKNDNEDSEWFFVDLDRNKKSDFFYSLGKFQANFSTGDFNGDGKLDLFNLSNTSVQVFSVDEITHQFKELTTLYNFSNCSSSSDKNLLGDFNGDHKMDFVHFRYYCGQPEYSMFLSTGSSFVKHVFNYQVPNFGNTYVENKILDINNDGKSDILEIQSAIPISSPWIPSIIGYISTGDSMIRTELGNVEMSFSSFFSYKNNEDKSTLEIISLGRVANSFKFLKNEKKDVLLKSITNGNGVKESIIYSALNDSNQSGAVYTATKDIEFYPNKDLVFANDFPLVSEIVKQSATTYKRQQFSYYGAVANVEGLGFLGFRATMRTNWFDNATPVISSVSKNNIALRGANIENFTALGITLPSSSTPSTYISKSILTYNTATEALQANKVFKLKNTFSQQFNGLDNTSSETTPVYDTYNNPTQSTTTLKNGATVEQTTVSNVVYDNQPTGTTYYVGRPTNKTQSVTVTGDVMNSEEKYVYTNHLLSQIKKRGNDLNDFITEDNIYDTFGNITKKTITAPTIASNPAPAPRVTSYEYDISGRFLTKSTDIEGLVTTFAYNTSSGVLNSETNPYSLTTAYLYDSWFKKTKMTDYLGKNNTYVYTRSTEKTIVTATGDDGSSSEETFDELGRKIKSGAKNIQGVFSYITYLYDSYDRNYRASEPYLGNSSPSQWNETKYDIYGRPIQNISYTGKTVNITYTGLTTVADEGSKSKSSIKNAIGNVISITDNPGGTITYTYFANGNLKSSTFNNTTTTITQDGWGRKLTLSDPSAGLYQYSYNGFGELLTETAPNPKGVTTYTLNDVGKLTQKTIAGDAANSRTTYLYDPSSKLLTTSTFEDLKEGTSTIVNAFEYDVSKRITKSTETTPFAIFTKTITYDAFGRIDKETSKAEAIIGGKSSSKTMQNTYRYGQFYMLIDDTSHRPKLQTNTVNARGQLLNGFIYNNAGYINVTNTYDTYNLLSQTKHDNSTTSTNMMTLNTVFDAQKGNLTSRTNSFFGTNQSFEYDEQDRLTKWADSPEVILNNTFDTTPDGFIADSGVTLMPNFSNSGMLAVKVTTANLGISKKIVSGASIGDTFKIKILRTTGDKISVILREQDASGTNFIDTVLSTVSGPIDQDYKIKTYSELVIKIIKTDANVFAGTPTFFIDNLNVQKYYAKTQQYDAAGKITQNELGTYAYNVSGKPYQNSSINPTPATATYYQTKPLQTITYNTFKSPVSITEQGVDIINFTYNDSNQRSTMFYGGLGPKESRRYHKYYSSDGTMEIKQDMFNNNAVEIITYIAGDGYSAPMIVKSDGTTQNYLYLHRDYQGTIAAISNDSGTIVEKRLFDPWGAIIKVQDGAGNTLAGLTILDRGYTGHEHLQSVGLIHMNGRLYDPKLHRFLQPDNFIQDPSNTQNYNRYGYCLNNPTSYVDPTGESYDDDDDPTLGWDYADGTEWIDKYGRWIYNKEFQTWIGKDGASDIFNAIALNDIVVRGNSGNSSGNLSSLSVGMSGGITGSIDHPGGDNWATATLGFISLDLMVPEATDAAWPKWAGYAVAATVASAYLYGGDYIDKMNREIEGIKERALGPPGYQYALIANTSGFYPTMTAGSALPTGTTFLKAGDVWKYGETTSISRYNEAYLKSIGVGGVTEVPQFYGNQMQIKIQEKIMIYGYYFTNGTLPAGNKIFR